MTKYAARGAQLKMGDGGGTEVFTAIAQVISIGGPSLSLDTEDATDHGSPGGWEEMVATILRSGTVDLDIHYDPADATHEAVTGLISKLKNRTLTNFQLVFADTAATQWDFAAFVVGFNPDDPHEGKLTASVSLKPSGQPTLA